MYSCDCEMKFLGYIHISRDREMKCMRCSSDRENETKENNRKRTGNVTHTALEAGLVGTESPSSIGYISGTKWTPLPISQYQLDNWY
jgi:hypothetical protein